MEQIGEAGTTDESIQAMAEAWDWLVVSRLVAPKPGEGPINGFAFVTRRGFRILEASDPRALLRAEERIAGDLHPAISEDVRLQFLADKYEFPALAALKAVEIRVRTLTQSGPGAYGRQLLR